MPRQNTGRVNALLQPVFYVMLFAHTLCSTFIPPKGKGGNKRAATRTQQKDMQKKTV